MIWSLGYKSLNQASPSTYSEDLGSPPHLTSPDPSGPAPMVVVVVMGGKVLTRKAQSMKKLIK